MSIYKRTTQNSIGTEKKCAFNKTTKNVAIKVASLTLLVTFISSSLVGCMPQIQNNDNDLTPSPEYGYSSNGYFTINGFTIHQISDYESERLYMLLDSYEFMNYTTVGITRRNYNYAAEDFAKIKELDETYLHAFYSNTTKETLTTVCNALGYKDIEDYLTRKGYLDIEGKPNVGVWYKNNQVIISEIMKKQSNDLSLGER